MANGKWKMENAMRNAIRHLPFAIFHSGRHVLSGPLQTVFAIVGEERAQGSLQFQGKRLWQ